MASPWQPRPWSAQAINFGLEFRRCRCRCQVRPAQRMTTLYRSAWMKSLSTGQSWGHCLPLSPSHCRRYRHLCCTHCYILLLHVHCMLSVHFWSVLATVLFCLCWIRHTSNVCNFILLSCWYGRILKEYLSGSFHQDHFAKSKIYLNIRIFFFSKLTKIVN